MWKRLFVLICFIGVLLFFGVNFVSAQLCPGPPALTCEDYCDDPCYEDPPGVWTGTNPPSGKTCLCSPIGSKTIEDLLDNVINYIWWFATAIVPIMIVYGAFTFMTAGDSVEKVSKAKNIIMYAIIGYAIVLFARGIVVILADILGS